MRQVWGDRRSAYRILPGKPEGNRALGRLTHRWEDNIKTDSETNRLGGCVLDYSASGYDKWRAIVNAVMKFRLHKMQGIS
jgi:hypothetical protein